MLSSFRRGIFLNQPPHYLPIRAPTGKGLLSRNEILLPESAPGKYPAEKETIIKE
jgi:hypothetical protein